MSDWNAWRIEATRFDIESELQKYEDSSIRTYREAIKEIKKTLRISRLMVPSVSRINRRIFTPRENARQRAMTDGILYACREAINIFKEADKYANDPYETLELLGRKIILRRRDWEHARRNYINDERNIKKIYNEMLYPVWISFLISAWETFLNQESSFPPQ